jgi:hypothetical protein
VLQYILSICKDPNLVPATVKINKRVRIEAGRKKKIRI